MVDNKDLEKEGCGDWREIESQSEDKPPVLSMDQQTEGWNQ